MNRPGSAARTSAFVAAPEATPVNARPPWHRHRRLLVGGLLAQGAASAIGLPAVTPGRTLLGQGILLPGLVDADGGGPMMTLVRDVWRGVPGWTVQLEALPLYRVVANVASGRADFGFPDLRLPGATQGDSRYLWSRDAMGRVSFVLYSAASAPLTRPSIEQAMARGGPFPFEIEAPDLPFGFPVQRFTSLESALQKVMAGRLDALLWAQEEADTTLRRLGLTGLHRAHFGDFDDVLMLHRGPRREAIDAAWSLGLARARASGQLAAAYRQVHRPFDPWQPGPTRR